MMKKESNSILIKLLFVVAMTIALSSYINSPVALVGGFLFAYFLGHPFQKLNGKVISILLKVAVVGLGFGMNIHETIAAGKDGFTLTVFSIALTLTLGYLIGKYLKLNKKTSHLISSGTAICGGSAIAAVSTVIGATANDISIALGVVFLLNSVALIIFPPIGHALRLTQHQFGLWSAIAIHDTSSVVGAAHTYGDKALKVATAVKLARALWIIPVSFLSMFLFHGEKKKLNIPWFIFIFLLVVIVNSYFPVPSIISGSVTSISKSLLVLTLFLIGAGLSMDKLKSTGIKPIILGVSLWVIISVTSLSIILLI